jgi:hypothetical protein
LVASNGLASVATAPQVLADAKKSSPGQELPEAIQAARHRRLFAENRRLILPDRYNRRENHS